MTVVADVVEYAQSIARAGVAAALAFSIGTAVDASNRVGAYSDTTAAAEKLAFVVGGISGPVLNRSGSQVIVSGLTVYDSSLTIADNGDPTKTLTFQCGSPSSGFGLVFDIGAQAANRTLSVPVLSGNRTIALIDQAQTISAIQTISATAGLVLSAATGTSLSVTSTANSTTATLNSIFSNGGIGILGSIFAYGVNHFFGAGGSGSANSAITLDGSSASDYGCQIRLHRNSVSKGVIGTYGSVFGGSSDDIIMRTNSGVNIRLINNSTDAITIAASAITMAMATNFTITTDASSSTAAGVTMASGLAVAKGQYIGTFLSVGNTATLTQSTGVTLSVNSTNAAAVTVAGGVLAGGSTSEQTLRCGSFGIQSYAIGNGWFGENTYYNGSNFVYRSNGDAGNIRWNSLAWQIQAAVAGTAGNTASFVTLQWNTTSQLIVGAAGAGSVSLPCTTGTTLAISSTTPSTSTVTGSVITQGGYSASRQSFFRGSTASGDVSAVAVEYYQNQSVDPAGFRFGMNFTSSCSGATAGNSGTTVGIQSDFSNNTAGITHADARAFSAIISTGNATAAITNATGYYFRNGTNTGTCTNKHAFYTETVSGGTNNYAFRSAGAGLVSIGDTTDATTTTLAGVMMACGLAVVKSQYLGGALNVSQTSGGSTGIQLRTTTGNSPTLLFYSGGGYRHTINEVDGAGGYLSFTSVDGTPYRFDKKITNAATDHTAAAFIGAGTATITGAVTDGYQSGLSLTPAYSGAFTVTRHNFITCDNPSLASTTLTDACVFRFNAAAGTHKAVDAATTKTTPGGVDAWIKMNLNGTLIYVPGYLSKTS